MALAGTLAAVLTLSLSASAAASSLVVPNTFPDLSACVAEPLQFSCENTTAIQNTCCSPTPGGLVLQTQFWDTHTGLEKQGQLLPKDSWGIHGLWPDFCDGSFTQYCDLTRQFDPSPSPNTTNGEPDGTPVPAYHGPGVDTFIEAFNRLELLDYMNKFWINQGAPNKDFWAHEFSKHATCSSTFDVKCFADYREHEDVINFFDSVVRAFKMFPTWDMLAAAGIQPSNTTTYTLEQLQNAIKAQTGAIPYFGCDGHGADGSAGRTVLDEVWYFNHVLGTEQYGRFKTIDSVSPSTCAPTGIQYFERAPGSEREVRI